MTVLTLTGLLAAGSFVAGLLGSMTGLGGGVVIVPLLVLIFHVDVRYAIGASLVSVIATSCGAAAAYVREGFSNIRVGMFLEVATTVGALCGAWLAPMLSTSAIGVVLGVVLLYGAFQSSRPHAQRAVGEPHADRLASWLRLDSAYPTAEGLVAYRVYGVRFGFGLMWIAGVLSGLLGIGSGALKVLAMDRSMRLPFKVSTTTSNFMIGVTAAASASVYLHRGFVDPGLAMPITLGVLGGSMVGARILTAARSIWLRRLFVVVLAVLAIELIYNGLTGRI
jgi:uncharacterized membrane protein YfcA